MKSVGTNKPGKLQASEPLQVERGKAMPLGYEIVPSGVNFSIFSRSATRLWLALFHPNEEKPYCEIELDPALHRTGDVWHLKVGGLGVGTIYAWRADGPWDPDVAGHRFDPDLYLLDPYARSVTGGEKWGTDTMVKSTCHAGALGTKLRSVVVEDTFDWEGDQPLNHSLVDSIIYEMHVRGFTRHETSKVTNPGTYQGVIEKIPYLQSLGITDVELLPVAEFPESHNIRSNPITGERLRDYWGYNPLAYFAPKAAYAADRGVGGAVSEFRQMVKELHRAGIGVILDVVFNHTAEGDGSGPTLSFRGLENKVYYILGENSCYHNYSGCGNTLQCNHPVVRDFILDCLRYWVTDLHVDGFRFDLASILGRGRNGEVLSDPPLLERIAEDPVLANTRIIAEAWDAAGLYQVGNFPAWGRWAEWNGKYRDDIRCFVKGDFGKVPAVASRVGGSSDLYQAGGRKPYHSVNFITSHDGFTLWDMVSYNDKHNEANGEDNRDGDNNNESWNHGVEGETDEKEILALRQRQVKNFLAILMTSQGAPMVVAGDEFLRTQGGNNNAYCQDSPIAWLDWSFQRQNSANLRFFREMVAFRKRHPVLRREHFFIGEDNNEDQIPDISWHGTVIGKPDWSSTSRVLAFLLDGSEVGDEEPDDHIFVVLNSHYEALSFQTPFFKEGYAWRRVVDTGKVSPRDIMAEDKAIKIRGRRFKVAGRSVVILVSKPIDD